MSVKFNDIMKKFYDDEMLGIQQEDAPANSVAGGGVSLPADAVSKKKQKEIQKKAYDGRTKKKMTDIINSGSKGQLMKLLSVIMK